LPWAISLYVRYTFETGTSIAIPIIMQGYLERNRYGRWEIVDSLDNRIEILLFDKIEVLIGNEWIELWFEPYLDGIRCYPLGLMVYNGMKARIKYSE